MILGGHALVEQACDADLMDCVCQAIRLFQDARVVQYGVQHNYVYSHFYISAVTIENKMAGMPKVDVLSSSAHWS
jgi:hypothetical protein